MSSDKRSSVRNCQLHAPTVSAWNYPLIVADAALLMPIDERLLLLVGDLKLNGLLSLLLRDHAA